MGSPKPRIELSIPNADIANADKVNKEPPKKKNLNVFIVRKN